MADAMSCLMAKCRKIQSARIIFEKIACVGKTVVIKMSCNLNNWCCHFLLVYSPARVANLKGSVLLRAGKKTTQFVSMQGMSPVGMSNMQQTEHQGTGSITL